jgi:uncharacterized protein
MSTLCAVRRAGTVTLVRSRRRSDPPGRKGTHGAGSEPLPVRTFLLHLGALLIGISKVGFGGGVGVVVTPLLATIFPPGDALGLTLPLLLATDLMALYLYRGLWDGRHVRALLPGSLVGIAAAAPVLRHLPPAGLARVIGGLAILFALIPWRRLSKEKEVEQAAGSPAIGFAVGTAAGFTSTLAHVGGIMTTLYLLPKRMSPATFVATGSVIFCGMNLAKIAPYLATGMITGRTLVQDLALLPTLALGAGLGFWLNRRIKGESFGRIILVIVILAGLKLLWGGA